MYKRLIPILLTMFLAAIMVAGCSGVQFTKEQTATMWNEIYNKQYAEYLTWFDVVGTNDQGKPIYQQKPNIPVEQIQILNRKKEIFKKLQPLLNSYSKYVATGNSDVPVSELQGQIKKLIQDLIKEGG